MPTFLTIFAGLLALLGIKTASGQSDEDGPVNTPVEEYTDEPEITPVDELEITLVDEPEDVPADEPEVTPADEPEITLVDEPEDMPVDEPEDTPVDEPEDTPVDEPEDTPVDEPEDTPVDEPVASSGKTYYVAPDGSDENSGEMIDEPLATLQAAHDLVQPGDTIVMRGGTYELEMDTQLHMSKSGTEDDPIRLIAYEDEQPILDGSSWTRLDPGDDRLNMIRLSGDHWHIEGLEVTGASDRAFYVTSANGNVFKDMNIHGNDGTGLSFVGESSNNTVLGGDFHSNFDPFNNGQNADGLAFKFGSGEGNVIDGARLFNNSDDGLDLFNFTGSVTLKNTYAYGNGFDRWDHGPSFEGNGVGFKLSGGDANSNMDIAHEVHNNVAWDNAKRGFDYNGNQGEMNVVNNTSYNNGTVGFRFESGTHTVSNNISFGDNLTDRSGANINDAGNSWNSDVEVDASDFLSLDDSIATGPRNPDGSLPTSDFLRLAPDSDLVDAGVDVGADFSGSAPDLGAYESGASGEASAEELWATLTQGQGVYSEDAVDLPEDTFVPEGDFL